MDYKTWIAMAGVVVSLVWNAINTRRNIRVDRLATKTARVTRFEALYGSSISDVSKELALAIDEIRLTRDKASSTVDIVEGLAPLRERLIRIPNRFAGDFGSIGNGKIASQPKAWEELALYNWDPILTTYDSLKQAANVARCTQDLSALEAEFVEIRKRVLALREAENTLGE